MRLYYIDESEGPRRYVRTALGVDAERWNDLFGDIYEWRRELQERYAIPPDRELHACDLLACWTSIGHGTTSNPRMSATASASTRPDSPSFRRSCSAFRCARFISQPGPSSVAAPARSG